MEVIFLYQRVNLERLPRLHCFALNTILWKITLRISFPMAFYSLYHIVIWWNKAQFFQMSLRPVLLTSVILNAAMSLSRREGLRNLDSFYERCV